ncbi:flagellar hook-length control protein FliK, partial [Burkholderia sp. LMU1-1-1.1]
MLPRFDAAVMPVRPADGVGAGAAVGDDRQALFQRALQGMVGKSVTAEVMSRFNDGSSLVKVADNAVRMMLPPGVNVGDQVPLTVLTASPRPTFQLGTGTPGASPTVVYSEGAADGGEALYSPSLPSQQAAGQPAGTGRPPAATVPGQPGQAEAGAADPDAVPGQA